MAKTQGSVSLARLGKSQASIAATLGVSRSLVGHWLTGKSSPRDDDRVKMRDAYGISIPDWNRPVEAVAPVVELGHVTETEIREGIIAQLSRLADMRAKAQQEGDLAGVLRIEAIELDATRDLMKVLGTTLKMQEKTIARHPICQEFFDKLLQILVPYPEASADVRAVIAELRT